MKSTSKKTEEVRYSKEELIANAQQLFSCQPEVLIGAWHNSEQDSFSIEETKQQIENFLLRKVQN